MRIVDNIAALRVHTQLTRTNRAIEGNTMRLSSGFRINSAGDDPAGFAISLHMRNQIRGMQMADRNTLDGSSLLETADGVLQGIHDKLHRVRELFVQGANDTYSAENRQAIQKEIDSLLEEINDTTRKVEFNNINLLNGEAQNLRVQVGGRRGMSISLTIPPIRTWEIGSRTTVDPTTGNTTRLPGLTTENWYLNAERGPNWPEQHDWVDVTVNSHTATNHIYDLDVAMGEIAMIRAEIGAFINRFEYTSEGLRSSTEATQRSLSRVFDTDMAYEMMMLSKHNVLSQAGMAIMAQLNARPQQILQLL
ncbi:MAG: flagellin [Defluviitaleaceae bacterium]|nr:flagellin [Defluviitaleaceae bacterium]